MVLVAESSHSPARGSHALGIKSLLEPELCLLPACEAASFRSSLPAVAGGALKYQDGCLQEALIGSSGVSHQQYAG